MYVIMIYSKRLKKCIRKTNNHTPPTFDVGGVFYASTATIHSISTGVPPGMTGVPTAERACLP